MATPVDISRVVKPFMPTLSHLALVRVSISLYNDFGAATLEKVYTEIQHGNSEEGKHENQETNYDRAKKSLLFVPAHLREIVMQAIRELHTSAFHWGHPHMRSLQLKNGECTIFWRCDGTVDTVKTFEKLVLDKKFDIKLRFEIACMQCLEKQIQILWEEMKSSGKAQNVVTIHNSMMEFWIRWMRDGSKVPWTQAARDYLDLPRRTLGELIPRYSSLFPFLQVADREKFLKYVRHTTLDDLRFCLYAVTKEEEDKILKEAPLIILYLYLQWPLVSSFLETVERMWTYLDGKTFCELVFLIFHIKIIMKDFDYNGLFEEFWSRSPNHLKESAEQCPVLSKKINSYFVNIRKKRKSDKDDKETNAEKKSASLAKEKK